MQILITGATGYIGRAVTEDLLSGTDAEISLVVRDFKRCSIENVKVHQVARMEGKSDWSEELSGVDVIVHLAGRAHVVSDRVSNPYKAFRDANVVGTLNLARDALEAGVKRFIFISSIGVNGSCTEDAVFSEASPVNPNADYALSKLEAERELWELVKGSQMELVVIRPPLVYSSGAPGNFCRLLKLVSTGVPLPFGSTCNKRSMIALENLVSFIHACIVHPAAGNQVFLVSDGVEFSTTDIVRLLSEGMGKKTILFPIPKRLVGTLFDVVGRRNIFVQLFGSLVVDSSKARELLNWQPVVSPEDAIRVAGKEYFRSGSSPE